MYTVGIITASDKCSQGLREDASGALIRSLMTEKGYTITRYIVLPDEKELISRAMISMSDEDSLDLVLTTGGTGFSPRDWTPEATLAVIDRQAQGIAEAMRMNSMTITPKAMLSRGVAGIRKKTLIINLPGSPKAVAENLSFILPALSHGLEILKGNGGECARS